MIVYQTDIRGYIGESVMSLHVCYFTGRRSKSRKTLLVRSSPSSNCFLWLSKDEAELRSKVISRVVEIYSQTKYWKFERNWANFLMWFWFWLNPPYPEHDLNIPCSKLNRVGETAVTCCVSNVRSALHSVRDWRYSQSIQCSNRDCMCRC